MLRCGLTTPSSDVDFSKAEPVGGRQAAINLISLLLSIRPDWMGDGLCQEYPDVTFFPERNQDSRPARRICGRCLVTEECRSWALNQGRDLAGIWGGTTRALRRQILPEPDPERRDMTGAESLRRAAKRQADARRPTLLMERISAFLAADQGDHKGDTILKTLPGGRPGLSEALQVLTEEGYLAVTEGGRNAAGVPNPRMRLYRHVRSYTEAGDDTVGRETLDDRVRRAGDRPSDEILERVLAERCTLGPEHTEQSADLYATYCTWAEAAGEVAVSQDRFRRALIDCGFIRYRTGTGTRWRGVSIDPAFRTAKEIRPARRPESMMERASTWLAANPGAHTVLDVARALSVTDTPAKRALVVLVDEGYVTVTLGPDGQGRRRMYRHARPYTAANEDGAEAVTLATSGAKGAAA